MCISEPRSRKPNQQELCRARMCPKHLQPNVRKDTLRGRPKRLKRSLKHNHLMPTAIELSCLLEVVAFWCFKSVKATWIRVLYSTKLNLLCLCCVSLIERHVIFEAKSPGGGGRPVLRHFTWGPFCRSTVYLTFSIPVNMQERQALRVRNTNTLRLIRISFITSLHDWQIDQIMTCCYNVASSCIRQCCYYIALIVASSFLRWCNLQNWAARNFRVVEKIPQL